MMNFRFIPCKGPRSPDTLGKMIEKLRACVRFVFFTRCLFIHLHLFYKNSFASVKQLNCCGMPRGRPRNVNLAMPEVPNNPQVQGPRIEMEFMRHNPPTFNGEGDPLIAERWVRALEKIFGFLQCTDKEMVTCALYQLVDDADFWWESVRRTISEADWELFTWEDFKMILYQKYIPAHYQHEKANEFWNLKQSNKSVAEYDLQFNRLSRYAPQTVDTEEKRIEKFRMGLKPEIGTALIGKDDASYGQMLS